jgi:hypothetical protein
MHDHPTTTPADSIDAAAAAALSTLAAFGNLTPWGMLNATGIDRTALEGNYTLGFDSLNVTFAVGLSELACDILTAVQQHTTVDPTHLLVYLYDGDPIPTNMPMVGKRPPKGGYKQTRFCPVVMRLRPGYRPPPSPEWAEFLEVPR